VRGDGVTRGGREERRRGSTVKSGRQGGIEEERGAGERGGRR